MSGRPSLTTWASSRMPAGRIYDIYLSSHRCGVRSRGLKGPTVGVDTHLSASGPSACCLKTTQAVGIPRCAIIYDKNQKNSRTIRVINNNKGTMNMKKNNCKA